MTKRNLVDIVKENSAEVLMMSTIAIYLGIGVDTYMLYSEKGIYSRECKGYASEVKQFNLDLNQITLGDLDLHNSQ